MKKLISAVCAVCLMISALSMGVFAADTPDMSGDIIEVTAANAQDVLDGKYGDITGKTIKFTENITTVLELARPTKYEGSKTIYYNYNGDGTPTQWSEDISSVMNSHSTYYRTLEDVTFTAAEGVSLAGFCYSSGHNHTGGYDYVRDTATGNGVTFYQNSSLSGITFDGLTLTGNIEFDAYIAECAVKDITVTNCKFNGDGSVAAVEFSADSVYYTNVTVTNCIIDNYFQGIYVQGVDGLTVKNNTISNTGHNAIAVQSSISNFAKGEVVIEENYMENVADRAIRVNEVNSAGININNNVMINCGDDEGEMFKAQNMGTGTIDLENNYWDGEDPADVVNTNAGVQVPETSGIVSGSFTKDVTGYMAQGKASALVNGVYVVHTHDSNTLEEVAEVSATTEAAGIKAHLECTVCGALFTEDGKAVTAEDLAIAKLTVTEKDNKEEKADNAKEVENPATDESGISLVMSVLFVVSAAMTVIFAKKKVKVNERQ